jgi:hypothetical protein
LREGSTVQQAQHVERGRCRFHGRTSVLSTGNKIAVDVTARCVSSPRVTARKNSHPTDAPSMRRRDRLTAGALGLCRDCSVHSRGMTGKSPLRARAYCGGRPIQAAHRGFIHPPKDPRPSRRRSLQTHREGGRPTPSRQVNVHVLTRS